MKKLKSAALYAALPAGLLFLWWALSALKLVNPYLIPSPQKTLAAAADLSRSGELARHVLVSLGRVALGFGMSAAAALLLALIFHHSSSLKKIFHGVFELLRSTPPLAMIPLLILWFGIGEAPKLAVIVLATFFPVFLSAAGGFASLDGRWRELAASLELSFFRRLRSVLVPAALPHIITGLRLGFGYAWRALLGAELFSSSAGLGYLITDAQQMARIDTVFAGILIIGLLGLFFDTLFRALSEKYTVPLEDRNWGSHV
ncbi:MAG: ABC transporter permease [Spirochaetales bacterium]|jgi:ABC-type nitrate/sulfonate/bicarbonate transport system permease component|nr:ABC transporter permease [Spirochaetales bacterium]